MRIVNRLLALIVSLALIATSIVIIVEVIAERSRAEPVIIDWHAIQRWAARNTWQATSVEVACAITLVAGLILLLPQLWRRRPNRLRLETEGPVQVAMSRKSVAVTVRGAVVDVEGITSSRVRVKRHRIRVTAQSSALDPDVARSLEPHVEQAATDQLKLLQLHSAPRMRVAVLNRRGGRV
jgi:hypothetical protein